MRRPRSKRPARNSRQLGLQFGVVEHLEGEVAEHVHLVALDVGAELDAGDEEEALVLRGGAACFGDAFGRVVVGEGEDAHAVREAARSTSWVGVSLPSDAVLWLWKSALAMKSRGQSAESPFAMSAKVCSRSTR